MDQGAERQSLKRCRAARKTRRQLHTRFGRFSLVAATRSTPQRLIHKLQISYNLTISYTATIPEILSILLKLLVRMKGLEPSLPRGNWNLNPARLPISPHPHCLRNLR